MLKKKAGKEKTMKIVQRYSKYDPSSLERAMRYFAFACAAGGALIPTELVALLAKLEKNGLQLRPKPEALLRLIGHAKKTGGSKGSAQAPPPNGFVFACGGNGTWVTYRAYPRYYDAVETEVSIVIEHGHTGMVGVEVTIAGRKEGVIRRHVAGFTGRVYGDSAMEWNEESGFGPDAPADIAKAVESMPPITED
jgi:hypothetical protein